ncbi:hypothetical protein M427DRAFT_52570 [Gonapodya prolifera JEL478]|uniref:Sugar phosphate transporter domain-containing protein n=1 Tax=Gonapodya prolifera (strain JEL478) TaxID=1344416 RepID=A0A139ASE5_GONPJ|nr:hypothetical protein M427DRAFT_52570 [Gonapodya prolifera JEL478]|eukprot:KXS19667.1 hypothetical protein M427DRAFT_52570 [Gonapodya prolifera JEL478]
MTWTSDVARDLSLELRNSRDDDDGSEPSLSTGSEHRSSGALWSACGRLRHATDIDELRSRLVTAAIVLAWFTASVAQALVKKYLLGRDRGNLAFTFPSMVSSVHLYIEAILCAGTMVCAPSLRIDHLPSLSDYLTRLVPLATITCIDVACANASLEFLPLSFHVAVRAGIPAVILFFSFFTGIESFSPPLALVVLTVCCGVALVTAQEATGALTDEDGAGKAVGMVLVLVSTLAAGVRWVETRMVLDVIGRMTGTGAERWKDGQDAQDTVNEDEGRNTGAESANHVGSPVALDFVVAPITGTLLLILSLTIEWPQPFVTPAGIVEQASYGPSVMGLTLAGGVLAFVIVMGELLVVMRIGVVGMGLMALVRELVVIYLAQTAFHDRFTQLMGLGLALTASGLIGYNAVRWHQRRRLMATEFEKLVFVDHKLEPHSEVDEELEVRVSWEHQE